ncbi:MAG TPA: NTP transferase domain-containing protein [Allosphingosinicella sp.]|nr:NTP transferase domain-containing protein [Allosphingosinicella sp.]
MNCLILAAGQGSRLRALSDSKPLTPIGGIPLIEHVVRRAAAAGARDFVVATGYQADRVEAFLATLPGRLGLEIRWVRTPDWERPNGHSAAAAAAAIDGDHLLLMSDHLFDPEIARRLLRAGCGGAGVRLVVDRDLASPLLDLDDATKVEAGEGGEIVRIGKTLASYNAIDTGIFLATQRLAAAIRADIAAGGVGSLSAGVQRLADAGDALTFDSGGGQWLDVDDPRSLRIAESLIGGGSAGVRDNAA